MRADPIHLMIRWLKPLLMAWAFCGASPAVLAEAWVAPELLPHELSYEPARSVVSWHFEGQPLRAAPSPAWHRWDGQPGISATRAWLNVTHVVGVHNAEHGDVFWVLDRGHDAQGRLIPGGAKLVALHPITQSVLDTWHFDSARELTASSRFERVWFDPTMRYALVHDAGASSLVVVDLRSRRAHRALDGALPKDATVAPDWIGDVLMIDRPDGVAQRRVPLNLLLDRSIPDAVRVLASEDRVNATGDTNLSISRADRLWWHAMARWTRVSAWQFVGEDGPWVTLSAESALLYQDAWLQESLREAANPPELAQARSVDPSETGR